MRDSIKTMIGVIGAVLLFTQSAFAAIAVPEPTTLSGLVVAAAAGGGFYLLHRVRRR